jgi:hypothetical protein
VAVPDVRTQAGALDVSSPVAGGLDSVHSPSFGQAVTDEAGNVRIASPNLTTKGRVLGLLLGAARGAAEGAGARTFGQGFQDAEDADANRALLFLRKRTADDESALRRQQLAQAPRLFDLNSRRIQAEIDQQNAQGAAENALANQRSRTPQQVLTERKAAAEGIGLRPGSPEYNQVVYGNQLRPPVSHPTRVSLALEAAGGDQAKALRLLTDESVRRAVEARRPASVKPVGGGDGAGITAAQKRLLDTDATVLRLKAQMASVLKRQGDPLSLQDPSALDDELSNLSGQYQARVDELLRGSRSAPVSRPPGAAKSSTSGTVRVVAPNGQTGTIPAEDLAAAQAQGYQVVR